MSVSPSSRAEAGFSLVEVLVALVLAGSILATVAGALVGAALAIVRARDHSMASALASARLEELKSLQWGDGDAGSPASSSDVETNLTGPVPASGGPGLSTSPATALITDETGYVDFLDRDGRWVGTGAAAPAGAFFVRRWSISALPGSSGAILLQVVVVPRRGGFAGALGGHDVRLVAVKARKAS